MRVATGGYGSVFTIWFSATAPDEYDGAREVADPAASRRLHEELRRRGVLVMPSPYGRLYTSFAHDAEAFDLLRAAFTGAAQAIAADREAISG